MNSISRLAGLMTACLLSFNVTVSSAKDVTPQPAVAGTWVFIGTTRPARSPDNKRLTLKGPHTDFRRVKLSVANAPVNLQTMVITFADGTSARMDLRANIPPGAESRAFDLPGARRNIRKIEFWYQTVGPNQGQGQAAVSVFGLK